MDNTTHHGLRILGRDPSEWLLSLPVFFLLLLTLVIGTGEMFHGQLLRTGESLFGDPKANVQYFMLRADPVAPDCNPNPDIDAEIAAAQQASSAPVNAIDALFADEVMSPEAMRASLEKSADLCREKLAMHEQVKAHLTPAVKAFRALETSFFAIFHFGTENRSLVLLLITAICAISTTIGQHHIGIRPPRSRMDFHVHSVAMVIANALLTFSCWKYIGMQEASGIPMEKPWLAWLWIALFGTLTVVSIKQLFRMSPIARPGGSIGMGFLSIPLYAYMSIVSGVYFLSQSHFSAQAIYLNQMMELSGIFLNLALYIWAGMLLKQTRIVDLFLDILRPWKFSPEMLTYLILLAAALPTAYTGASGIFVIAAGAVIYHEVRHSGGSRQLALAATAMSGSLGVVLRPCLLVVLIAALNKQVTTSILYDWGLWVFLLTSSLFLIVAKLTSRDKTTLASPSVAIPGMIRAIKPVIPYMIVVAVVIMAYKYLLNTKLDEFTAAVIMPVIMLMLVVFDRLRHAQVTPTDRRQLDHSLQEGSRIGEDRRAPRAAEPVRRWNNVEVSVRHATNETIGHIGALLMLMALSLGVGGVIERSEIMELAPHEFSNVWIAMTFLMVTKVLLGMVMDPFGAVILVSSTLAPIAYANGIDPVHFWMMVLVAFELGYLLPPVALNQLLTRLVVGEKEMDEADAEVSQEPFYRRYERWILPVIVMTVGMLIVAYGPLIVVGK